MLMSGIDRKVTQSLKRSFDKMEAFEAQQEREKKRRKDEEENNAIATREFFAEEADEEEKEDDRDQEKKIQLFFKMVPNPRILGQEQETLMLFQELVQRVTDGMFPAKLRLTWSTPLP